MNNSKIDDISIIVLGNINVDIFGHGVERLLQPGELSYGGTVSFGAGGKSRNIAQMTAALIGKRKVAMIGRTSKDPYGLWKIPMDALQNWGVNTKYIKVCEYEECGKMPGIALIPVDKKGENQIYVLPGANEDFCREDVERSRPLFESAKRNKGAVALTLEIPRDTIHYAIQIAQEYELPIFLDAGGARIGEQYDDIIRSGITLLKPNQHETTILTKIRELQQSRNRIIAERNLWEQGVKNILITMGKDGAYLYTDTISDMHIQPPTIEGTVQNTAGCGDQTMAGILYGYTTGKTIEESTTIGIIAGTIKSHKKEITPVTKEEIERYMEKI